MAACVSVCVHASAADKALKFSCAVGDFVHLGSFLQGDLGH